MNLLDILSTDLDIFQANINTITKDINVINSRTRNIRTENAVTNEILKFDGTNWIPSNEIGADGGQSLAYKTSAASSAADATAAASQAIGSRDLAFAEMTSAIDSQSLAAAAASEAIGSRDSAAAAKDALDLAASSKVNVNSPDFTGDVNLPSGAKINGIPISISPKIRSKAVRAYTRGAPDFREPESRPDNQILHIHFHDIEANTYGTPTLGNSVNLWSGTASLWNRNLETNVSGVTPDRNRTYFKVPPGRGGNYQITINILGEYSFQQGNGVKSEHFLYRRRNSVDEIMSYKIFEFVHVSNSIYAGALKFNTESIDNVFELEGGDELFVMVKVRCDRPVEPWEWWKMYRVMGRRPDYDLRESMWETGDQTNFIVMEL